MTTTSTRLTWSGAWVEQRLGVRVREAGGPDAVRVHDLVGLALRRNPRRVHLLVSTVLGKHVPVRPSVATAAGRALGAAVAARLTGAAAVDDPALRAGLLGTAPLPPVPDAPVPVAAVIGFAETATALGHLVADVLDAPYLHSTRRPTAGLADAAAFEEAHSHATSHLLTPQDPGLLAATGPLVLVDDELSTGATALATIRALHRLHPRDRYAVAALVDVRTEEDRARIDEAARALGCRIDVVALASGRVELPDDVLTAGAALVAGLAPPAPPPAEPAGAAVRVRLPPTADGGRTGFTHADRAAWRRSVPAAAALIAPHLPASGRVHVLGTEELMAFPLAVALELERTLPGAALTFSSTTRSPVAPVDDPGSAVRAGAVFPAHDDPADGPGDRFVYNVRPGLADAVVVVVDAAGDTPLLDGLVHVLRAAAPSVVVAVLPAGAAA